MATGSSDSKPAIEVTTGFSPPATPQEAGRKHSANVSEAYRETILRELSRGRNAMGIWQDMVDQHGFAGGYQSVKRLVRTLRGATSPEARAIIDTRSVRSGRWLTTHPESLRSSSNLSDSNTTLPKHTAAG